MTTNISINHLSRDERLALIQELWESLAPTQGELALTGARRDELDRRLDEMDVDTTLGIPWDQVLKQIREPA
ncbi:MAG TPA: addiction module protein [Pyrinomonadaceae bacterium]|jgi:putative addiction module component (TIGR02574 family)|nr:addiction module protein [Pyrinomonadaceae bacterium]